MKSPVLSALLLATLAVGPLVPAQVAKEGEGYRIRTKYVPGEKTRFAVTTDFSVTGGLEGMPSPPNSEVTVEQEVTSVKDGITTLKVTTTGAPSGTAPDQTIEVDERGQIVGKGKGTSSNFLTGFPEHPLKVGEKWSAELPVPGGPEGMEKMKADYTFLGLIPTAGEPDSKPAAQIDFKMSMAGKITMEASGWVRLDPADGQLLAMATKSTMTMSLPSSETQMTIVVSTKMKRLP